jgi:hypothetical protein
MGRPSRSSITTLRMQACLPAGCYSRPGAPWHPLGSYMGDTLLLMSLEDEQYQMRGAFGPGGILACDWPARTTRPFQLGRVPRAFLCRSLRPPLCCVRRRETPPTISYGCSESTANGGHMQVDGQSCSAAAQQRPESSIARCMLDASVAQAERQGKRGNVAAAESWTTPLSDQHPGRAETRPGVMQHDEWHEHANHRASQVGSSPICRLSHNRIAAHRGASRW